jgi:MFS family permease
VLESYRRLLRNRALTQLLAGEFISGIGDWLYLTAIVIVIYTETRSAVLLGVIGAARILPYVLLSVPAGIVVDRYDRRLVLLVTDVARGLLMLLLAAFVAVDAHVGWILAAAIAAACFSTFFGPAIAALLPTLVDESELGQANSAWATLDNLAFVVGPALAGLLIAAGGLTLAFILNAASFAVVAIVLWRLPVRQASAATPEAADEPAEGRPAKEKAAWRGLLRPLAGPFVLDSVGSFVGGGLGMLTVVIAIEVIRAGEAGTGYLNAAIGVGGVVAGIAAGVLVGRRLSVPLLVGGVVSGIGLAWLGLSSDLLAAMVAIGIGVGGALLLDVVNTTLIQRTVPDEMRGRAVGVLQTTSSVLYAAGSLLFPILAGVVGVTALLITSGVAMAGAALVALVLSIRAARAEPLDPARSRIVGLPIFAGLPSPRLEAAASAAEPRSVAAGEVIVREGDPADRFYIIGDGRYAVTQRAPDGGEVTLRELGRDDVFGEIGLLRRSPRTATVTAVSDGMLFTLPGDVFLELVGSGPGLSTRLLDLYRGALSRA